MRESVHSESNIFFFFFVFYSPSSHCLLLPPLSRTHLHSLAVLSTLWRCIIRLSVHDVRTCRASSYPEVCTDVLVYSVPLPRRVDGGGTQKFPVLQRENVAPRSVSGVGCIVAESRHGAGVQTTTATTKTTSTSYQCCHHHGNNLDLPTRPKMHVPLISMHLPLKQV